VVKVDRLGDEIKSAEFTGAVSSLVSRDDRHGVTDLAPPRRNPLSSACASVSRLTGATNSRGRLLPRSGPTRPRDLSDETPNAALSDAVPPSSIPLPSRRSCLSWNAKTFQAGRQATELGTEACQPEVEFKFFPTVSRNEQTNSNATRRSGLPS
jgi:hypothetical protein